MFSVLIYYWGADRCSYDCQNDQRAAFILAFLNQPRWPMICLYLIYVRGKKSWHLSWRLAAPGPVISETNEKGLRVLKRNQGSDNSWHKFWFCMCHSIKKLSYFMSIFVHYFTQLYFISDNYFLRTCINFQWIYSITSKYENFYHNLYCYIPSLIQWGWTKWLPFCRRYFLMHFLQSIILTPRDKGIIDNMSTLVHLMPKRN